jgi:hypothetical protein
MLFSHLSATDSFSKASWGTYKFSGGSRKTICFSHAIRQNSKRVLGKYYILQEVQ